MKGSEIRKDFLNFFEEKGHKVIPSSSLIPDDPSVLLTTAGMQQFKKYYTAELNADSDFNSLDVASSQKCFRTSDIDEVGDETHNTFFEMLGNFSFGGYWKEEAIEFAYQFVVERMGLKIDYVSVFEGDSETLADDESEDIWKRLKEKYGQSFEIKKFSREDNFWGPTGSEGPCGPTTEVYVNGVEIWNVVFNEFYKTSEGKYLPIEDKGGKQGIDTGMGLERLVMAKQEVLTIFDTDLLKPVMDILPNSMPINVKRIVADHLRGSVFLIGDGVEPSNKEAGYILRRLIRRVVFYTKNEEQDFIKSVIEILVNEYKDSYDSLDVSIALSIIEKERDKFLKTLQLGIKELNKKDVIDSKVAFRLYESFGLPYEVIKEVGAERANTLNELEFEKEFRAHQAKSRAGAEKKFGGHGLILDTGEIKAGSEEDLKTVTRLHTVTHLMQYALRKVLSDSIGQMGSDITPERTRFDFSFDRKLTESEVTEVEDIVNNVINSNLPVKCEEMSKEEAISFGALHFFKHKYPDKVKVYYIGETLESAISKEFCGGPHISSTKEIGKFKVKKQEAVSSGVRRIRGVIE